MSRKRLAENPWKDQEVTVDRCREHGEMVFFAHFTAVIGGDRKYFQADANEKQAAIDNVQKLAKEAGYVDCRRA